MESNIETIKTNLLKNAIEYGTDVVVNKMAECEADYIRGKRDLCLDVRNMLVLKKSVRLVIIPMLEDLPSTGNTFYDLGKEDIAKEIIKGLENLD